MTIDTLSPTWKAIAALVTKQMDEAQARINARGVDQREADADRGVIELAQRVLDLGKAAERPVLGSTTYA